MKKLVVLLLVAALGFALYRRLTAGAGHATHLHGTPDHWPPVVRKPGSETPTAA